MAKNCFAGLKGKPVKIRSDPVTVRASFPLFCHCRLELPSDTENLCFRLCVCGKAADDDDLKPGDLLIRTSVVISAMNGKRLW